MRREWIEILLPAFLVHNPIRLPPCGGSGLKSVRHRNGYSDGPSPSMRREWIEMELLGIKWEDIDVSLHAEGVD